jgi:hypothetical protein
MNVTDVDQGAYGMPYSGPPAPPSGSDPNPIHVGFAGPFRQQRLTVLVRAILGIPHLVVLYILGIAAGVVVVIGWFGALFTGRLPDFAEQYLTGYLRWEARVLAYDLLLTGTYPPFSPDDADYPVRLAVAPGRLNPLVVFFRLILAIPAGLLSTLLTFGAFTIVLFVTWLIVLFTGTMPLALHQALSAVLRYYLRYIGYVLLLTDRYPAGVFGDQPPQAAASPLDVPAVGVPTPAEPGTLSPDASQAPAPPAAVPAEPSGADGPDLAAAAVTEPESVPGAPVPPPTAYPQYGTYPQGVPGASPGDLSPSSWAVPGNPPWPLALSGAARKLVSLFMALGVLGLAAYVVLIVLVVSNSSSSLTRDQAITRVQAAQAQANLTLTRYSSQISACNSASDVLQCATRLDKQAAQALGTFGATVRSLDMPSAPASAAAGRLADAAANAQHAFAQLGAATSISQYESIENSVNFQQLTSQISQQFQALGAALSASP